MAIQSPQVLLPTAYSGTLWLQMSDNWQLSYWQDQDASQLEQSWQLLQDIYVQALASGKILKV
jgi:hypothetical protein